MEALTLIISIAALVAGIVAIAVAARKKVVKEVVETVKTEVVHAPVEHPFTYDEANKTYNLEGNLFVSGFVCSFGKQVKEHKDMKVYIVQENYSYTSYDSVGNEEEVVRRGIVGVCLTTEDALLTVEKALGEDCCEYYDVSVDDYDVVIADLETGRLEHSSYDKIVAETKGKEEEV